MWKEDSELQLQRLHIEGITQPLFIKFSSVWTLLCISLQANKDFDGGIEGFQINLAQCRTWYYYILKV
jgi:hypothetical protein